VTLEFLEQVTWGIHVMGHEGGQGGGASPGGLKLLGVRLGVKEKVGGDNVENQKVGPESLHSACLLQAVYAFDK
jgi:hypothetical protein